MIETADKPLPQDAEAEQIVLATLLAYPQDIQMAEDEVRPVDFISEANGAIYHAIIDLYHRRQPIEYRSVWRALRDSGEAGRLIITELYLHDLQANKGLVSGYVGFYAQKVRNAAMRRQLLRDADRIALEAWDDALEVDDVLTRAGQRLTAYTQGATVREGIASIGEYADRAYSAAYKAGTEKKAAGLRTGWDGINELLRPFRPGQLIAISADTGIGKTCWTMNLALDLAKKKKRGLVFTYEMSGEELTTRAALRKMTYTQDDLDSIDIHENTTGVLNDFHNHLEELKSLPLRIDENNRNTPDKIERAIQAEIREFGKLDFVVVDYIGMVPSDGRRKRYEELGEISRFFKELPKTYHFVMFVLCQLGTKRMADRACRRPQLEDVYESGRIPQDCDLFAALYWPYSYGNTELAKAGYDPKKPLHQRITEFLVLKSRQGVASGLRPHTCQRFEREHVRYHDVADHEWRELPEKVRPK